MKGTREKSSFLRTIGMMSHLCTTLWYHHHFQPVEIFLRRKYVCVCVCCMLLSWMMDGVFASWPQWRSVPHNCWGQISRTVQKPASFLSPLFKRHRKQWAKAWSPSDSILHVCFGIENKACDFSVNRNFPYGINKEFVHPSVSQKCLERMTDRCIFVNPQTSSSLLQSLPVFPSGSVCIFWS